MYRPRRQEDPEGMPAGFSVSRTSWLVLGFRLTDYSTMTLSLLEGYSMGGLSVIGAASARDTGHTSKYRHHEIFLTHQSLQGPRWQEESETKCLDVSGP